MCAQWFLLCWGQLIESACTCTECLMVQMLKLFGFSQAELLGIRKPNMFGGIAMNGTAAGMHTLFQPPAIFFVGQVHLRGRKVVRCHAKLTINHQQHQIICSVSCTVCGHSIGRVISFGTLKANLPVRKTVCLKIRIP